MDPLKFTGRSAQQVEEFIEAEIEPIRRRYPGRTEARTEIHV
jgi:adenylosuccinate lyase